MAYLKGPGARAWKGDSAGYAAKHVWVSGNFGKASFCEECGLTEIPPGMKRYFDWANISGKYLRERSDWKMLCRLCHAKMDSKTKPRGGKQGSSKLTEAKVRVIRKKALAGKTYRSLAIAYKVSPCTVRRAVIRETWKHVL